MSRSRPTIVTIIAILHFLIGGLGLCCETCGGLIFLAGGEKLIPQPDDAESKKAQELEKNREEASNKILDQKAPWHKTSTVALEVATVGLCLVLVIAGFGLLGLKPWGRWMSVGYAIVSLAVSIFILYYTFSYGIPAQQEAARQFPADNAEDRQMDEMGLKFARVLPFVFLVYPIVVLIAMFLPNVSQAFQPGDPEDDHNTDRYDVRRRPGEDQSGWAEH
jgi:hypothetical protein